MNDSITLTGFVATPPRHIVTSGGLPITSFRMATTQRRFDRAKNTWVDGDTNWYTINSYRQLAVNAAGAIHKGEPVVVLGRLRIRPWESNDRQGTTIEIEAEALGHDLVFGTSSFTRSVSSSLAAGAPETPAPQAQESATPATDGNGWAIPGGGSGEGESTTANDEPAGFEPDGGGDHPESVPVPF